MPQHLGKNIVFVLALVAAGFLLAWLRFRPYLEGAGSYSDGAQTYDVSAGAQVRYAIWDPAFVLPGEVNTHEDERAPALSPDGRHLVFTTGDLEEGGDLWLCDIEDGRPRNTRPLTSLNSARSEIAPAFSEHYLYFASNRAGTAGGFDLWRAPYAPYAHGEGGEFGEPERLAGGINTNLDECDPAPSADDSKLIFASNRSSDGRGQIDFDLYSAGLAVEGPAEVVALTALNTEAEERDPALTLDGSALFFASDRRGNFDLYRSPEARGLEEVGFLAPRLLESIATEKAERGPAPSQDGFTLTFSQQAAGRDADLARAHSRELFRQPGRPVGWVELVILAALLLLALLAKLSTRWSGLEVLYKCLLVSILAHLLLLWWFRNIHPEAEQVEFEEEGERIRVHLIADRSTSIARNSERGGRLEAQRAAASESELERVAVAAGLTQSVEAPAVDVVVAAAPKAALPSPVASSLGRAAAEPQAVDVRREAQPNARRSGGAPALEQSLVAAQDREQRGAEGSPERQAATALASDQVSPNAARVETRVPEGPLFEAQVARGAAEFARTTREATTGEVLREPSVSADVQAARGTRSGSVAVLDVGEAADLGAERMSSALQLQAARPLQSGQPEQAASVLPKFSRLSRSVAGGGPKVRAPERHVAETPMTRSRAGELAVDLAVEAPMEGPQPVTLALATPKVELQAASFSRGATRPEIDVVPTRFARKKAPELLAPGFKPLATRAPVTPDRVAVQRERWDHTPYQSRSGSAKLRALEEHGGSQETEQAVAAGLAYLAERQRSGGNWGRTNWSEEKYLETTVGKTGLSMLAFMGAGHTQQSDSEYSGVVGQAMSFLLDAQDERTGHFGLSSSYSHAIATYALAECFALTKDKRLRVPLARAIEQITRHQVHSSDRRLDGGWGYYYPDGRTFDRWPRASVTVWQVMALESARLGGLKVEDEIFADAKGFLLGCWDRGREAFRYSHDPDRLSSGYPVLPGSTPASLFALSILGVDVSSREFGPARTFVLERKPGRYEPRSDDAFVNRAEGNLYFWYYSTLSLFRAGGPAWDAWNVAMKRTLLGAQAEDGSWAPRSPYSRQYAGDTNRDRCYSTAMCVLSLEVYYRYFTPLLKVE